MICNSCKHYKETYWSNSRVVCDKSKAIREQHYYDYHVTPTCIYDKSLELNDKFEPIDEASNAKWIKEVESLRNKIIELNGEIQNKDKAIRKLMS